MPNRETKEQREARLSATKADAKRRKAKSVSDRRCRGKVAPGRKSFKRNGRPSPEAIARLQAMNRIKDAMERGLARQAKDEFFAWVKLQLLTPNDNWLEVIECELEWCNAHIGSLFRKK